MLRAESLEERAPAMAALWNLSLRSNRCEEIREQMMQCEILPALANIAELIPNAMVSSSGAYLQEPFDLFGLGSELHADASIRMHAAFATRPLTLP